VNILLKPQNIKFMKIDKKATRIFKAMAALLFKFYKEGISGKVSTNND
jgi:hypothetical protein